MPISTNKVIASVPVEIWQICWSKSSLTKEAIRALTLTCSLFRDICQPLLFRYILLHCFVTDNLGEVTSEGYQKWEKKAKGVLRKLQFLVNNPQFGKHPKLLTFSGVPKEELDELASLSEDSNTIYSSMMSKFASALGLLSRLRVLLLQDIDVNDNIAQGLAQLTFLKELRLQSTDFLCRKVSPLITAESLSIVDWQLDPSENDQIPPDTRPLELFSVQKLKSLEIHSFQHVTPCLSHLASQGASARLTTLKITIDVNMIPVVFTFLETCPQIKTLSISSSKEIFHPKYPQLSSSALPVLSTFSGIASLGAIIIPNRPVETVILQDSWTGTILEERQSSTLAAAKKSTAKVSYLSLPFMDAHPEVFGLIVEMFPHLHALELRFNFVEEDTAEVTDNIPQDEEYDISNYEPAPIEVDEGGLPKRPPTSVKGIFDWLCLKKLPLPPSIHSLAILQRTPRVGSFNLLFQTFLSYKEQHNVLNQLCVHYPSLTDMTFGRRHIQWGKKRVGGGEGKGIWEPVADYKFFIEHRHLLRVGEEENEGGQEGGEMQGGEDGDEVTLGEEESGNDVEVGQEEDPEETMLDDPESVSNPDEDAEGSDDIQYPE